MLILKVSTEIRWEKMSNRINRIIGSIPRNGKSLSGSASDVNVTSVLNVVTYMSSPLLQYGLILVISMISSW